MIELEHDEVSRQLFSLALNHYTQTTLAEGSRRVCEQQVEAQFSAAELDSDGGRSA